MSKEEKPQALFLGSVSLFLDWSYNIQKSLQLGFVITRNKIMTKWFTITWHSAQKQHYIKTNTAHIKWIKIELDSNRNCMMWLLEIAED